MVDRHGHLRIRLRAVAEHRSGFSLIEVLIALALTVLLLSAIYSAVGLHLRFQTAGRGQIYEAQLTRAVIRKMDEDFGAVVLFIDQSEEEDESTSVENLEQLDDVSDSALTVGGLESAGTPPTFGVVGTTDFIHLCVSRPLRDLSYDSIYSESPEGGRSNDLLTVTYGLGPVDFDLLIDPGRPKYSNLPPTNFAGRPETGFARRSIDLYAFDAATDLLEAEHVIAPTITELQFAYFDGTAWLESWDSRVPRGLPLAVRATFGLWYAPSESKKNGLKTTSAGTVRTFEHVFHIPLAIPILEE